MTRRLRLPAAVAAALAAVSVVSAAPAMADTPPPQFQAAQNGLTYSVYGPRETFSLPMKFKLRGLCGAGQDEVISAQFGNLNRGQSIQMFESAKACQDGPDGIALVGKFKAHGKTFKLFGFCPTDMSTCNASQASVTRGGYVTGTLPSGGNGLSSTFLEMYTTQLPASDVKDFVRGLTFVG